MVRTDFGGKEVKILLAVNHISFIFLSLGRHTFEDDIFKLYPAQETNSKEIEYQFCTTIDK